MADPGDLAEASKIAETSSENVTKETKKMSDAFQKLSSSNVDIIKGFSNLGKSTTTVTEQLGALSSAVKEAFGSLEGLSKTASHVVDSFVKTGQELANTLDKSRGEYVKATGDVEGATSKVSDAMYEASQNISKFGVNLAPAFIAIRQNLPAMRNDFEQMNQSVIKAATTVSILNELGVSANDTAEAMKIMADNTRISDGATTNMATATADAAEGVASFALVGQEMGYTLQESVSLFKQNADIVTVFGDGALKNLMATAKSTNLELSSLVAVSEKFNTFESAAQQVGKLNALLGADYLGVTEMMFAEPAEQVKMISGAFEEAGLTAESLDSMSEAEKKFTLITVQNTLGLKSQSEALRFLQADEFDRAEQLRKDADDKQKQVETQERLNQVLLNSMPALEQLSNSFKQLADVLTPVFMVINKVISALANFVSGWSETTKTIVGWIVLIVAALFSLAAAGPAAGAGAAAAGAGAAAGSAGVGVLGAVAQLTWPQILALGGAILLMGAGIGLAAYGISFLVKSFGELNSGWQILAATLTALLFLPVFIISTAVALGLLALLGEVAVPVLLAIGAGFVMIGLGVLAASYGISLILDKMVNLGSVITIIFDGIAKVIDTVFNGISKVVDTIGQAIVNSINSISNLFTVLGQQDATKLFSLAGGIMAIAAALVVLAGGGAASTVGSIAGGVLGGVAGFLGMESAKTASDPLKMLGALSSVVNAFPEEKLTRIANAINLLVTSLNTPVSEAAILRLEQAAKVMREGVAATSAIGAKVEPKIEIREVVIRFDDVTEFRGYVEDIIYETVKQTSLRTQ